MTFDVDHELSAADLGEIVSIPMLARRARWSYTRMYRFLIAKNEELGGQLLLNTSRGKIRQRYGVSLSALQVLAPQFFIDPDRQDRQLEYVVELVNQMILRMSKLERRIEIIERRNER